MLERLLLPFECIAPEIDETIEPGETPWALARRLSLNKARAVARLEPRSIVIGADQVLDFAGCALGKPGSFQGARAQLKRLSGQKVTFHSGLAVVSPSATLVAVVDSVARFRTLSAQQIDYYLAKDEPFDTAGSAKAEQLGISLLDELSSEDPTAIIGLPLIALTRMLVRLGLDPLMQHG